MDFKTSAELIVSTDTMDIVNKEKTISEIKAEKLYRYYRLCYNDEEREFVREMVEHGFSIAEPFFENMTLDEYKALAKYGAKLGSNSYEINYALRNNKILSDENRKYVYLIDNVMKRFHLKEELIVYRALKPMEAYHFDEMIGDTFTDQGYMSTSLTKEGSYAYFERYPIVLEITLPIDTSCVYVEWFKGANDEAELILGRGTTISIGEARTEVINGYEKIVYSCCVVNQIAKDNLVGDDYRGYGRHK